MQRSLFRDALIIVGLSVVLGVAYNGFFSVKSLPWIRQQRQVDTVSTKAIVSLLRTSFRDTTIAMQQTQQSQRVGDSVVHHRKHDTVKQIHAQLRVEPRLPPQNDAISPPQERGVRAVTYQQVQMMLRNEDVLFMDARRKDEYDQGHIPRAINVDIQLFELDPTYRNTVMQMLYSLDKQRPVVTYCGGGNCELSHKLSELLTSIGFDNVFIYLGGWNEYSSKPDSPRAR